MVNVQVKQSQVQKESDIRWTFASQYALFILTRMRVCMMKLKGILMGGVNVT